MRPPPAAFSSSSTPSRSHVPPRYSPYTRIHHSPPTSGQEEEHDHDDVLRLPRAPSLSARIRRILSCNPGIRRLPQVHGHARPASSAFVAAPHSTYHARVTWSRARIRLRMHSAHASLKHWHPPYRLFRRVSRYLRTCWARTSMDHTSCRHCNPPEPGRL